jgi:hypothetical protein
VKDPEMIQHFITFGAVGRSRVVDAQETAASTPKWVKTMSIRPILGEWERANAWYGHVAGESEVGISSYGGLVSFSTRHDNAQRTSYVHHSSKPITSFFPAQGSQYTAAPRRGPPADHSRAKALRASEDSVYAVFAPIRILTLYEVSVYDAQRFVEAGYDGPQFDYRNYTSSCPLLRYEIPADTLVGIVHTVEFIPTKATGNGAIPDLERRLMHNIISVIVFASLESELVQ